MIKVVLFDLDGTLLPMEQEDFVKEYFSGIAKSLVVHGYEPEKIISTIWAGTKAMIFNDGSKTNEQAFWDIFIDIYGQDKLADKPYFEEYYKNDFDKIKNVCGYNPKAKEVIEKIKALGLRVVLATNPIFPTIATYKRIDWAGLSHNDFEFCTTYEDSYFCKPSLGYYNQIIEKLGVKAEECLMVGNDVTDDMVASRLGIRCFLITDNLINKGQIDINTYDNGGFDDLLKYIEKIKK